MIWFCKDPKCKKFEVISTSRKFLFFHYWNKPRERLIELILDYSLLKNPYQERKMVLANVLADFGEIKE